MENQMTFNDIIGKAWLTLDERLKEYKDWKKSINEKKKQI